MKFSRDPLSPLTIQEVKPGLVRIGGDDYVSDIALTADGEVRDFAVQEIASLQMEHLNPLLESAPEMLIVGTGWDTAMPPRELVFALARRGIGLEVMGTPAACRTFNILVGEGRRPAAIIKIRQNSTQSSNESAPMP